MISHKRHKSMTNLTGLTLASDLGCEKALSSANSSRQCFSSSTEASVRRYS